MSAPVNVAADGRLDFTSPDLLPLIAKGANGPVRALSEPRSTVPSWRTARVRVRRAP